MNFFLCNIIIFFVNNKGERRNIMDKKDNKASSPYTNFKNGGPCCSHKKEDTLHKMKEVISTEAAQNSEIIKMILVRSPSAES